ncbi:MAG: hypothetical protein ACKPKO_56645, partial [Candidatus Fonsibacter sp.]
MERKPYKPVVRPVGPMRQRLIWKPMTELLDMAVHLANEEEDAQRIRSVLNSSYNCLIDQSMHEVARQVDYDGEVIRYDEGPRLRQVRSIPIKRKVKAWKPLDKPWRWCYNRLTELHALLSWDHGSTSKVAWVIDADGICHMLADEHIPAYVANENNCMEIVHSARELLEALIDVMEFHYDTYSWEK